MANSLLPPEERNLTPDQVEALDKRRDLGHTFLVIAGQFAGDRDGTAAVGGAGPELLAGVGAPDGILLLDRGGDYRGLRNYGNCAAQRDASDRLNCGWHPRSSASADETWGARISFCCRCSTMKSRLDAVLLLRSMVRWARAAETV